MKKNTAFSLIELSIVIMVIGVLIAGVIQGSRMIGAYKVSTAISLTNNSPVNSISGLTLWFEPVLDGAFINASNSNDISNNDYIATWKDINSQATSKNDGTQSTSANRPQYKTNAINSLPAVLYDGTDCLDVTNNLFAYDYSVFAVVKTSKLTGVITGDPFAGIAVVSRDVPGNANDSVPLAIVAGYLKTDLGTTSGYKTVPSTGSVYVSDNKTHIIYSSRSIGLTRVDLYMDGGNNINDTSMTSAVLNSNTAIPTTIGCVSPGQSTNRFEGYIAEVIVFDRVLKSEERRSIEQYLSKKWSVAVSS